jgi:hypothetical protein
MNIFAAAFLLPVGVMFYTAQGGLKASYVASWANTGELLLLLLLWSGQFERGGVNRRPFAFLASMHHTINTNLCKVMIRGYVASMYVFTAQRHTPLCHFLQCRLWRSL